MPNPSTDPLDRVARSYFRLPRHDPANGFVVRLQLTSTTVVAVRGAAVEALGILDDSANLRFGVLLGSPSTWGPELQIIYRGEPPEIAAVAEVPNKVLQDAKDPSTGTFWDNMYQFGQLSTQTAHQVILSKTPIQDEFKARRAAISNITKGRAEAEFFYDMDAATYYPLLHELGQHGLAKRIERLGRYLHWRAARRATYARYGLRLGAVLEDLRSGILGEEDDYKQSAKVAEGILRKVFNQHLTWNGRICSHKLSLAVYLFVTGRLLVNLPGLSTKVHGVPNGSYFFCFAEALYLFRDWKLDWNYWAKAVPVFAMAAEVFTQLYWSGAGRREKDYAWQHVRHNGDFSLDRWRALESAYRRELLGLTREQMIEECFGDTVARALRDRSFFSPSRGMFIAPGVSRKP